MNIHFFANGRFSGSRSHLCNLCVLYVCVYVCVCVCVCVDRVNGGMGLMTCSSEAVLYWERRYYDGTSPRVKMINITSSALEISNLSSTDEGLYVCHYRENTATLEFKAGCLFVSGKCCYVT